MVTISKTLRYIISLTLAIILSQCSTINPAYLAEKKCTPPCWFYIEPNRTLETSLYTQLQSVPYIKVDSIERRSDGTQFLFPDNYFWKFIDGSEGRISIADKKIFEIEITLKLSLGQCLELYGAPEKIVITPYYINKWHIFLLYQSQGIIMEFNNQESPDQRVIIQNSNGVERITFISIENFSETIALKLLQYTSPRNPASIIQNWEGFGQYRIITPKP